MNQFNNTKYTRWYWAIVENRLSNPISVVQYSETHHIVPESFYKQRSREGSPGWLDGDPGDPSNLVRLTAREHFVCHWLLVKMTTGIAHIKMRDALEMMGVGAEHQNRYTSGITSRVFERNRIEVAKIRSERMKGDANPTKRPAVGEAISKSKLGKKRESFSPEWIANMSEAHQGERNSMYGKNHSDDTKEVLRAQKLGKTQDAEHVKKRADAVRGSKRQRITCPHCRYECAVNTYPRFHGDNCKHKQK